MITKPMSLDLPLSSQIAVIQMLLHLNLGERNTTSGTEINIRTWIFPFSSTHFSIRINMTSLIHRDDVNLHG